MLDILTDLPHGQSLGRHRAPFDCGRGVHSQHKRRLRASGSASSGNLAPRPGHASVVVENWGAHGRRSRPSPRAPAVSWTRRLTRSQGGAAGRRRAQERPGRPRVWNSGAGRQLLEMPRGGAVARHGREEESHPHPGPLPPAGVQREIESCPFPRPRSGRGQCEGAIPRRCAGDLRAGSPDAIVLARSRDSGAADFFVR